MARNKGILPFSGNFEPQAAGPFDARQLVQFASDLIETTTWEALDKSTYVYPGFFTVVWGDPNPDNIGMYYLRDSDFTVASNWVKVASGDAGVSDYNLLTNKPSINGTVIEGALTTEDLGLDFLKAIAVDVLPATGEANTIYLVPSEDDPGFRDEYLWQEKTDEPGVFGWDKIGNTVIDLSNYPTTDEVLALLTITDTSGTSEKVGGIDAGTVLTGDTVLDVLNKMLYKELNPALSNPSGSFNSNSPSLVEVGSVRDITFTATLNRGSISPAYGTSGNRSGPPNAFAYTGAGLPTNVESTTSPNSQTINHTFAALGAVTWGSRISYDAGEQPLTNKGNNYSTPLAAGQTNNVNVTVTAVNPVNATTNVNDVTQLVKQPLVAPTASYIEVAMAGETETDKQKIQFGREMGSLTRVDVYNTISKAWETLGGSSDNSLLQFTVTEITIQVNGTDQPYYNVQHNGSKIGARELRFYT